MKSKTESSRKRIVRRNKSESGSNSILDRDIQKKLEAKFDELFGTFEDEEDE